jgi:ubiquinone/menaquinone biosynthesis C-methylase UbiE
MAWREQFGRPRGVLGWVAGKLMARGKGEFSLDLLGDVGVAPTDRVLEIGFGPGIGIEVAARLASQGRVFGVDISDVMLRMATRRNRDAIRAGRVELSLASVSELPFEDETFDVVFSTNSVQFWPDLSRDLKEVHRVVRRNGRLALGVQLPPWILPTAQLEDLGRRVEEHARAVGFREVVRMERAVGGVPTTRVLAKK